jgi:hypothetical protein
MIDHLLHAFARVAIRIWPPLEAKRRIDAIGSLLGPVNFDEAYRCSRRLRGGTCLSRAMVIASRVPGAEVVIGANRKVGTFLHAHAWVEAEGKSIGFDATSAEIARLK